MEQIQINSNCVEYVETEKEIQDRKEQEDMKRRLIELEQLLSKGV